MAEPSVEESDSIEYGSLASKFGKSSAASGIFFGKKLAKARGVALLLGPGLFLISLRGGGDDIFPVTRLAPLAHRTGRRET